jgi:hypothetical protein
MTRLAILLAVLVVGCGGLFVWAVPGNEPHSRGATVAGAPKKNR